MGDGGGGSATVGEVGVVGRANKGSTGVIGVSEKVRKDISSTEKVKEDGRG